MIEEEFKPRRPDFKGENVSVWVNKKRDQEWLTVKVDGEDKAFVAFKLN